MACSLHIASRNKPACGHSMETKLNRIHVRTNSAILISHIVIQSKVQLIDTIVITTFPPEIAGCIDRPNDLSTAAAHGADAAHAMCASQFERFFERGQFLLKFLTTKCVNSAVQTFVHCLVHFNIRSNLRLPLLRREKSLHPGSSEGREDIDTRTI